MTRSSPVRAGSALGSRSHGKQQFDSSPTRGQPRHSSRSGSRQTSRWIQRAIAVRRADPLYFGTDRGEEAYASTSMRTLRNPRAKSLTLADGLARRTMGSEDREMTSADSPDSAASSRGNSVLMSKRAPCHGPFRARVNHEVARNSQRRDCRRDPQRQTVPASSARRFVDPEFRPARDSESRHRHTVSMPGAPALVSFKSLPSFPISAGVSDRGFSTGACRRHTSG